MKYLIKRCKVALASLAIAGVMAGVVSPLVAPETALATGSGLYSVYQGNQCLGAYSSKDVAIREAKKWADSDVKQNGSVIWAFTDTLYKVYQGSQCLGAYSSKDVAIREAGKWSNSKVVQNGISIWTYASSIGTGLNDGLYRVYQGNQCLGAYSGKDVAIREARKWNRGTVVQNGSTIYAEWEDYRNAYSKFIHGGELRQMVNRKFSDSWFDYIPDSDINGALYDIDKDGTPELILVVEASSIPTTNIAIYEFKNNKVTQLINDMGSSGSGHWFQPYRDKRNGDFYFYYNFRYYIHYFSYKKGGDLEEVYSFDNDLEYMTGNGVTYRKSGFDPSNLEEIKISPIKSLKF